MTSDTTRARFGAFAAQIEASSPRDRWLVLTHDNPDPDALASTAALALILRRRFHRRVTVAYGGMIGRDTPQCLPLRIAVMKRSSVQVPRPDLTSGVRLAVKLMPHGPAQAVLVPLPAKTHGASSFGAGGTPSSLGWPLSARLMSGSGPFGPILNGVWQSWQLPNRTR